MLNAAPLLPYIQLKTALSIRNDTLWPQFFSTIIKESLNKLRSKEMKTDSQKCACGSPDFSQCCGPIIDGTVQAATPEQLMRARYSAYATGAIDFLTKSNHSKTRPQFDPDGAARWSRDSRWLGLTILSADSVLPGRAHVNFEARYENKGGETIFHRERSLFELEDGEWRFVSGGGIPATSQKIGRNELCPCGSGKKHKKCCGA